jgi:hypothetical protein
MEAIQVLDKRGVSLWQLVLLVIVFFLRQEVRLLLARVAAVKIGDKEVAFHQDTSVSDLKIIKEQLLSSPNDPDKAIKLINDKIDSKLVAALSSIRRETLYLWPAIQKLSKDGNAKAQIQQQTLDKVQGSLKSIEDAGLLTYDVEYIGPEQYGILEPRVKKLDAGLESLIAEAEKK